MVPSLMERTVRREEEILVEETVKKTEFEMMLEEASQ